MGGTARTHKRTCAESPYRWCLIRIQNWCLRPLARQLAICLQAFEHTADSSRSSEQISQSPSRNLRYDDSELSEPLIMEMFRRNGARVEVVADHAAEAGEWDLDSDVEGFAHESVESQPSRLERADSGRPRRGVLLDDDPASKRALLWTGAAKVQDEMENLSRRLWQYERHCGDKTDEERTAHRQELFVRCESLQYQIDDLLLHGFLREVEQALNSDDYHRRVLFINYVKSEISFVLRQTTKFEAREHAVAERPKLVRSPDNRLQLLSFLGGHDGAFSNNPLLEVLK
mmetsp:Transcript_8319/g.30695  ORF Transcript_8319/g.30695 Transcript_8319/m.30695 type:complete len:287 (+) Transcript_8319:163-1023(+)